MTVVTRLSERVPERSTAIFSGRIVDQDGEGFRPESLLMTLYDMPTGQIINERRDVDVTSCVDAEGGFELELEPADNVIIGTGPEEYHALMLTWSWDGSQRISRQEIRFRVVNLAQVE